MREDRTTREGPDGLKRHVALEPFSRDHNEALVMARSLAQNRPGAVEAFQNLWVSELQDHFTQEELLLGPLLDAEKMLQLRDEHEQIQGLKHQLPESASELGKMLEAHVRWEERTLFTWIESNATEEQLNSLRLSTDVVEESRWEASPKRKELVERRRHAEG